jgi:hypothetical protein
MAWYPRKLRGVQREKWKWMHIGLYGSYDGKILTIKLFISKEWGSSTPNGAKQ